MPLQDTELARRVEGGDIELRPGPLRLRWKLTDLVTADGHRLEGVFSCSVRALPDRTEKRMLAETFLATRTSLRVDDVVDHFAGAFSSTAARLAAQNSVADWLDEKTKPRMIDALRQAGKAVAFSCGLELLEPFHLDLDSPSFQQQRLEAMQRQLAEQRAATQAEQIKRAIEVLRDFNTLQEHSPGLSPSRLLERLSPTDQGGALQMLLLAAAQEQQRQDLWAVAGPYLVRIDLQSAGPRVHLHPLPPMLGPLRSVQPATIEGQRRLLAGAQSGVLLIDPLAPEEAVAYADRAVDSVLGFSGAIADDGWIFACHGQAGIVGWRLGSFHEPAVTLRPAELPGHGADPRIGPRHLRLLDEGRLIFALGSQLVHMDYDARYSVLPQWTNSPIVAIVPESQGLWVVHEDGYVVQYDRATLEPLDRQRRAGSIAAAGTLPFLGTWRLLLASEEGPIFCVGLDDPLITQYTCTHRGLRAVAGSTQFVVGVSPDRQRLVLWHTHDGRQPFTEVHVTSQARHRIADVDFA